ncbi:MAG: hypothetical protein ACM3PP_07360 [Candidatus Saccharibacteria bacterium]
MNRFKPAQVLLTLTLAILLITGSVAFGNAATNPVQKAPIAKKVTKKMPKKPPTTVPKKPASNVKVVTIQTSRGSIVMELYPALMPITVTNFEKLV